MRVAMYYNNNDIRIEEIPKPDIGKDEILVKVIASGICGSDVMEWYRIKKAPLVLGHEITGIIEGVGESVKNYRIGDRVFVSHHVPCDKCHYCLTGHHTACDTLHNTNYYPGGFSEHIRVPRINVEKGTFLLPNEISFEDGTLIEPLACVVRGQRLAKTKKGDTVLVIGSGISGLLHIKLARFLGAERIITTDIDDYRLKTAKKFGADFTVNAMEENLPEKLKESNDKRPADLVIVCTGAEEASIQALKSVDRGGRILFFAVPKPEFKLEVPINDFWRNEIEIMTSYAASPKDIKEAIELIRSKNINVHDMITHILPLEETGLGFKLVAKAEKSIKVVIKPHDNLTS